MYGYIYKITNLINEKKYIGKHKSASFDKDYFGSGKIIKQAVKKEGKENFRIDIIEWCENKEQLNEAEKYWIKFYDAQKSEEYYNIASGGEGNEGLIFTEEQKLNLHNIQIDRVRMHKGSIEKNPKKGSIQELELLLDGYEYGFCETSCMAHTYDQTGINNPMYGKYGKDNPNYGSKRTEEQRRNISKSCIGRKAWNKGKEGTAKGTVWYYNEELDISKMIHIEEIDRYENLGYKKGRKPKK